MHSSIPISLYIHVPWCIKKCPYCDFNSHVARTEIPEHAYLQALITDFEQQLSYLEKRKIETIFIGGGTPSLMSADFYAALFKAISPYLNPNPEITLEANPGTIDVYSDSKQTNKLAQYREIGINRLSFGIQSLQNDKLKYLGRMHGKDEALMAIDLACEAGFDNFNCDLMFGLPKQTQADALSDLQQIINKNPTHISWYQLTIEPDTHFYRRPPILPDSDLIFEMQQAGIKLLSKHGYQQYEISAYTRNKHYCQHNLNYWQFGDYLGIGAGAHGKFTRNNIVTRTTTAKHPRLYLEANFKHQSNTIEIKDLIFDFMLNALRLNKPVTYQLVEQRTGMNRNQIIPILNTLAEKDLVEINAKQFSLTVHGRLFTNDVLESFLL